MDNRGDYAVGKSGRNQGAITVSESALERRVWRSVPLNYVLTGLANFQMGEARRPASELPSIRLRAGCLCLSAVDRPQRHLR